MVTVVSLLLPSIEADAQGIRRSDSSGNMMSPQGGGGPQRMMQGGPPQGFNGGGPQRMMQGPPQGFGGGGGPQRMMQGPPQGFGGFPGSGPGLSQNGFPQGSQQGPARQMMSPQMWQQQQGAQMEMMRQRQLSLTTPPTPPWQGGGQQFNQQPQWQGSGGIRQSFGNSQNNYYDSGSQVYVNRGISPGAAAAGAAAGAFVGAGGSIASDWLSRRPSYNQQPPQQYGGQGYYNQQPPQGNNFFPSNGGPQQQFGGQGPFAYDRYYGPTNSLSLPGGLCAAPDSTSLQRMDQIRCGRIGGNYISDR